MRRWARNLLLFLLVAACCWGGLWAVGWLVRLRSNLADRPLPTAADIEAGRKLRDVHFDPDHTPTLHIHEHVTAKNEAPMIRELVDEGKLPALNDRVPDDPIVMKGVDGIGKYGGTWMRLANNLVDVEQINYR